MREVMEAPIMNTKGAEAMTARHTTNWQSEVQSYLAASPGVLDTQTYLLSRYGSRMTKKEVCFERKNSRATTDNERNPRHPSYNSALAAAEVQNSFPNSGRAVLFDTLKISELLKDQNIMR